MKLKRMWGIVSLLAIMGSVAVMGQTVETKDYTIFAGNETKKLDTLAEALSGADIVFIGELHDHSLGHRLKLDILKAIYARKPKLALSMEMFERDVQSVLDEYLAGYINESAFLAASRPWPNYKTDYRPLVEFCRENKLPVVAANAPRRYVNIVSRKGQTALGELPKTAKTWLPELPYPMDIPSGYDRALNEVFGGHGDGATPAASNPAMPSAANMKQAQMLWDESMKDSILRFQRKNRGRTIVQVNGSMHSDSGFGIVDRVRKAAPRLKTIVVTIRPDDKFPGVDATKYAGQGDFVILTRSEPKKEK